MRDMAEQDVPSLYHPLATITWQPFTDKKCLCGSFGIQAGHCETSGGPTTKEVCFNKAGPNQGGWHPYSVPSKTQKQF